MLTYLYLQETDVRHQVEQLKRQRAECIQKIAHLKQQIVEIETQENEAIREVGFLMDSFLDDLVVLKWLGSWVHPGSPPGGGGGTHMLDTTGV